jgi:multidrug transporter EmrE-like cation transporter
MENKNIKIVFAVVLFIVFFEAIAQACLKKSKLDNKRGYICISVISYFIICLLLLYSYEYNTMGRINLLWSCFSIIVILLTGTIFYHEKIYSYDLIGIGLIIIGMYFVYLK